jgi:hypothetical protein
MKITRNIFIIRSCVYPRSHFIAATTSFVVLNLLIKLNEAFNVPCNSFKPPYMLEINMQNPDYWQVVYMSHLQGHLSLNRKLPNS